MNNEAAFPTTGGANSGMSIRDYFAAKAMQALISGSVRVNDDKTASTESRDLAAQFADAAYLFSDAMLEARKA